MSLRDHEGVARLQRRDREDRDADVVLPHEMTGHPALDDLREDAGHGVVHPCFEP